MIDDQYDMYWDAIMPGPYTDPYSIHKTLPNVSQGMTTTSVPMVMSKFLVTIRKEQGSVTLLRFLEPFHWKLWLAIVVALFAISGAIVLIHVISPLAGQWGTVSLRFALTTVYHTWAAFLGGEDYEWLTTPAKILRIALLFLVLISSATYTANLAAFFTKPNFKMVGPQNLEQLSTSTVCGTYSIGGVLEAFAKEVIFPPDDMTSLHAPRADWCVDQMRAGKADAMIDQAETSQAYLLQHCDELARAHDIEIAPFIFAFVIYNQSKAEWLSSLNTAMLSFAATPGYQELLGRGFSIGRSCQDKIIDSDTQKITLEQMEGFFIIFGTIIGFAVVAAFIRAAKTAITSHHKKDEDEGNGPEGHGAEGLTDAEMLVQVLQKVDDVLRAVSPSRSQSRVSLANEKDIEVQSLSQQISNI
eukprot:gnl/MRDRNA2_/MRDRNA2_180606_c0_seq1.p1 gnl/MRDRNA2_/MRDRNA2_180606_c0~~gnl/MRDRNA2_/MRDRNA2_180606_c0_seq1.p1  ORF type:complete len:430 (-),score=48.22 gnl/MRDRNA2_/MRDRNA2_180606_c0_seq1:225-1469(-)